MDPSVLLAGLQRMDDEGVMFQVELLEQLCSVLAMSESRDMLAVFEPSQFVPALGAIMGRESHVFPETPVLACRAVKHFISLDPRLSRVAVRANLGTLCLSALALSAGGDGATEEAGDLAECAIKVLEMLCKREGRQVARGVPGGAHVAVGQLLGFIEVCDAIYPPDVTESALMALRGVLSSCPASETHAHEAAPVLCRLIGDTDRPKLQYAALQGMASLTSVLSIARETAALELIAADVSSELIGALGAPRASPAALSLELLVLWRLCSASPAVLHGCLKRGLAGALAGLLRESCTGASPSKGVEASATELLRFASALASLLGAVTPAAGPGGRRAEEYLPQSSYAANAEGDADAAELLREAIKRDDLASVCALIDLGGQPVTFSIWDIGGHPNFTSMLPMVCNDAAVLLFVFDLSRRSTLDNVRAWYTQARSHNKNAIPILVGTKYDLFVSLPAEEQDEITSRARQYARAMKAPLVFCSPCYSVNVINTFKVILVVLFELGRGVQEVTTVGRPILEFASLQI
mmetsp:Transcript_42103/g.98797  ORF Transcript_42103/g.98797 Transcript_42103/m.98797 type:complete len:524 (+) Transcript_42103:70-1641(+)